MKKTDFWSKEPKVHKIWMHKNKSSFIYGSSRQHHGQQEKEKRPFPRRQVRSFKLLEQKTMSQTEIAKKLGCSQGQVSNISKKRDEIRAEFEKNANPDRKRQRSGKASDVEGALSQWFIDARARDIPLSGPILTEKAADLAKTLGKTDFNPTSGWLSRWKGRNNISYKKLQGEKKDADLKSAANWIDNVLPGLLNQYDPADVYNADETGLYFRALPENTLTFKTDDSGGSKKSKERVTALVACNMTGSDKQKLLIVGKSKIRDVSVGREYFWWPTPTATTPAWRGTSSGNGWRISTGTWGARSVKSCCLSTTVQHIPRTPPTTSPTSRWSFCRQTPRQLSSRATRASYATWRACTDGRSSERSSLTSTTWHWRRTRWHGSWAC